MRIYRTNINTLPISNSDKLLLNSLLDDLDYMNQKSKSELFIDWQDYHDEYSQERTDPCPDYYGMYTIRSIEQPYEILGVEMDIHDLDNSICLLYNYIIDL